MALKANNNSNSNSNKVAQPVIEADVYAARLVQIIDLGLQPQKAFKGVEKSPAPEIMLTYELSEVFMIDEDGNEDEDKPRWVSETLPLFSLKADRAKSTMRYNALDPDGTFGGDFSQLIGTACNVTLINNSREGKTYTNVAGVSGMSSKKAEKLPELKNDPKVFDIDTPDLNIFQSLPQWIQEKIKSNLNYKGSALEKALGSSSPSEDKPAPKGKAKAAVVESEENPF